MRTLRASLAYLMILSALAVPACASIETVYTTKSGAKFHKEGCRFLKKSKIAISRSDATSKGMAACKVCKP